MKKSVLLSITLLIFILLTSCNIKEEVDPGDFVSYENGTEIKDIDGNIYHTINIGSQVWLVENLKTTRFQNGDTITNSTTNKNLSCYCVYNSDTTLGNIYGNLYNSNAVSDKRNICPKGWRIPSERDIKILINHLLNTSGAGNVLKESGAVHWGALNIHSTNATGFTALPGGGFNFDFQRFDDLGKQGFWWLTDSGTINEVFLLTSSDPDAAYRNFFDGDFFSVRCFRN